MKKINLLGKIINIILLALFITVGIPVMANAYTYDGDIDPMSTATWQILGDKVSSYVTIIDGQLVVIPAIFVIVKNPIKSPINTVTVILNRNQELFAYWYIKNGIRYDFEYDQTKDRFVQIREE